MKGLLVMERTQIKQVVRQLAKTEINQVVDTQFVTKHVAERISRLDEYIRLGLDTNDYITGFEVDKGHTNGNEYHLITTTGLIKVYNKHSAKLITILGARGGQIYRYFAALNIPLTSQVNELISMCYERERQNPIHLK